MGGVVNRVRNATHNANRVIGQATECPICNRMFLPTDTYGTVNTSNTIGSLKEPYTMHYQQKMLFILNNALLDLLLFRR